MAQSKTVEKQKKVAKVCPYKPLNGWYGDCFYVFPIWGQENEFNAAYRMAEEIKGDGITEVYLMLPENPYVAVTLIEYLHKADIVVHIYIENNGSVDSVSMTTIYEYARTVQMQQPLKEADRHEWLVLESSSTFKVGSIARGQLGKSYKSVSVEYINLLGSVDSLQQFMEAVVQALLDKINLLDGRDLFLILNENAYIAVFQYFAILSVTHVKPHIQKIGMLIQII